MAKKRDTHKSGHAGNKNQITISNPKVVKAGLKLFVLSSAAILAAHEILHGTKSNKPAPPPAPERPPTINPKAQEYTRHVFNEARYYFGDLDVNHLYVFQIPQGGMYVSFETDDTEWERREFPSKRIEIGSRDQFVLAQKPYYNIKINVPAKYAGQIFEVSRQGSHLKISAVYSA